jgi:peptidyl-prolyl cis-trans isomerase B (cyclophilin B)
MGNKRARDRQLAKLAARRQAERRARQRRRTRIAMGVGGVAIALALTGFGMFARGDDSPQASPPSAGPSAADLCSAKAPPSAGEEKPTFRRPPEMTIDRSATYVATMKTSCGTVQMELSPDVAPVGVNSFVFLASQGYYDGLTFHRIVADFVIQGGDPEGTGRGGPGYEFETETSERLTFADGGMVAYANSGPDTNGSQFFITLGPTPQLDPTGDTSYTIFGKVTKGMDVVQRIGAVPTVDNGGGEASTPTQPVYIESIAVDERR